MRAWRLDDGRQTLVLAAPAAGGLPAIVHWGGALPEAADPADLAAAARRDRTGGTLDLTPPLSLCPEPATGFPGHPGLVLRTGDGRPIETRFAEVRVTAEGGLGIEARDGAAGLTWRGRLAFEGETGMLTASAEIEATEPIWVEWLSAPVVPAPPWSAAMIDIAGRWCGEFQLCRTPWSPGARVREGRGGRTGHDAFPGLIIAGSATTNGTGPAIGFHYGWSGGHGMVAEELADGRRQIQFGHVKGSHREAGRRFVTATLCAARSDAGLNGVARAFQRHVRRGLRNRGALRRPRPIHYNCWEAVYFRHDPGELAEIAAAAADLGAERFVLDDGWFLGRRDDRRALGDWVVDPVAWPDGLDPLIDRVEALGMTFGLWVEPEMVNPDSDLYRAHPDWAIGPPDQPLGRHQMVLDLGRAAVRDHLFDVLGALLAPGRIGYLKWDHNRVLPRPDTAQTDGLYALLDRLRAAHPKVEIESCASGGGRIDFGILRRTERVWLSDSNDALERARMHHDSALFLPGIVVGAHMGPSPSHTSGRRHSAGFRAWVAAMRHMGLELDPRGLSAGDADVARDVIAWWKSNRDWRGEADILRLDTHDPTLLAEIQVAEAGDRFVVFAARMAASAQIAPRPLQLAGIDRDATWRVALVNPGHARLSYGEVALKAGAATLPGAWLLDHGLVLPITFPERMWVIEGTQA